MEDNECPCSKEVELAVIQRDLHENTEATKEILKIIKGTNGDGLMTKLALQRQSLGRLWWWTGGVSLCLLAVAGWVIRSGLMK